MQQNYSYRDHGGTSIRSRGTGGLTQPDITTFSNVTDGNLHNPKSRTIVDEKPVFGYETAVSEHDLARETSRSRGSSTPQLKIVAFAVLAFLVLIFNTVVLILMGIKSQTNRGLDLIPTIFEGTCDKSRKFSFWIHLLINVLSTILLMGSSDAMQTLTLMFKRRSAAQNQPSSSGWLLWAILAISSTPLHLLYNSAVFETLGTTPFYWAVVAEDFVHAGPASYGTTGLVDKFPAVFADMRANGSHWDRLNNSECIQTYGSDYLIDRRNVLLVTSNISSTNTFFEYGSSQGAQYGTSFQWMCQQSIYPSDAPNCTLDYLERNAANWTVGWTYTVGGYGPWYSVKYCLSEPITSQCWVQLDFYFLVAVTICNLFKAICFILCLRLIRKSPPLLAVGDMVVRRPRWWFQSPSPFLSCLTVILSLAGLGGIAACLNMAITNEKSFDKSVDFKSL